MVLNTVLPAVLPTVLPAVPPTVLPAVPPTVHPAALPTVPTFTSENDKDEREYDDEEDNGLCEYELNDAASDNEDEGSMDNRVDQCTAVGPCNKLINAPPSIEPINAPPSNEPINADSSEEEDEEVSVDEEEARVFLNEQDFFNQHNDYCEVCNQPGKKVLCCATCNLVFHVNCVRPKLQEEPPNDWKYAYCCAAGVMGGKKHGKVQLKSTQARREMEWMRRDINDEITEDDATPPVEDEATLPVEDEDDSNFAKDVTD